MAGKLSTHVLDTTQGRPARGMRIELWSLETKQPRLLKSARTNADGRTDSPLLAADEMKEGEYELVFHVGNYFGDKHFLDRLPVRFHIDDASLDHHVPLLVSPYAYSVYRGS